LRTNSTTLFLPRIEEVTVTLQDTETLKVNVHLEFTRRRHDTSCQLHKETKESQVSEETGMHVTPS